MEYRLLAILSLSFFSGILFVQARWVATGVTFCIIAVSVPLFFLMYGMLARIRRSVTFRFSVFDTEWRKTFIVTGGIALAALFCLAGIDYGVLREDQEMQETSRLLASARAHAQGAMLVTGQIVSPLVTQSHSVTCHFQIQSVYSKTILQGQWPIVALRIGLGKPAHFVSTLLRFYSTQNELSPGARVAVYLRVKPIPPGKARTSFLRDGILLYGSASIYGIHVIAQNPSFFSFSLLSAQFLTLIEGRVWEAFGAPSGYLLAFSVGDRHELSKATIQAFVAIGLIHALVASGATFRMSVSPLLNWMKKLRSPPFFQEVAMLLLTALLLLACGFAAPTLRAAIVFLYGFYAQKFNRRADSLTGNALAMVALCFIQPHDSVDPGVWLSFAAGLILVHAPPWVNHLLPRWMPQTFRGILARGLSAEFALTPLVAFLFHQFAPLSFLINLLLYPILEGVIPLSSALLIAACLNPREAHVLAGDLSIAQVGLNAGAAYLSAHAGVWKLPALPWGVFVGYYGLLFLFVAMWNIRIKHNLLRSY